MNKIYPVVKESDVIVLATPLYYWTMSGQIRTALDRLFALEEGDGNLLRGNNRASALLMVAEGNGFEDALLYYDHLMEHLRWKTLVMFLPEGMVMWEILKGSRNFKRLMNLENQLNKSQKGNERYE